jgi:hypothetical protein
MEMEMEMHACMPPVMPVMLLIGRNMHATQLIGTIRK